MPSRPPHPCPGDGHQRCGRLVYTARCTAHSGAPIDHAEQQRNAAAVAAYRAEHGDVCPGYGRPAHPSNDLTADHTLARARGGGPTTPLEVLCRRCNSARGAGSI